jgi:hypothetical protein
MNPSERKASSRGSVMIFVVIALGALLAFVAWATETGRITTTRNQIQAASDSSALAGTGALLINNFTQVDPAAAVTAAQTYGGQHVAGGVTLAFPAADVETGSWDLTTSTFTPLPGSTDPNLVRAVRVTGRRDPTANGPLPAVFGNVVGFSNFNVGASAVGYIGWAGLAGPGEIELPIVIDCCAVSGSTCSQYDCQAIATNPPNPCPRTFDGKIVTCLEFFATTNQNACWSEMDPSSPSVNSPGLQDIVQNGNTTTVGTDPIFIDNGTKTPVVDEIHDKFYGLGNYSGNPSGTDTDGDGIIDSWKVGFPMVECQNPGDHCAGGTAADIVGFVCFDLQEVEVTPSKVIRGEFACPSECAGAGATLGPGGTVVGGISATYPVLVQ